MRELPIYTPPGGPPQGGGPSHEIFAAMGEKNITQMLEDFYLELGQSSIRGLFPQDLVKASRKSALFFVFLCGGPPLFHERIGPPMMRKRHLPFKIDNVAKDEWLRCFQKTLENADQKYQFPMEHMPGFVKFLQEFSQWMVNSE
jgi:hemoglobin